MPCKHRFHSACIKNWIGFRFAGYVRFADSLCLWFWRRRKKEDRVLFNILWTINKKEEGVLMLCSIWVLAHWSIWYFGPYRFQVNSDRNLGSNRLQDSGSDRDSVMDMRSILNCFEDDDWPTQYVEFC